MNTFLPYRDFILTAKCLDYKRLGKQRVEAWMVYQCLKGNITAWKNHPCVKMWDGYILALLEYGLKMCMEWKRRGYEDNMAERFIKAIGEEWKTYIIIEYPPLFEDKEFINGMRSNLLRKNKDYYEVYNWGVEDNLPYKWKP